MCGEEPQGWSSGVSREGRSRCGRRARDAEGQSEMRPYLGSAGAEADAGVGAVAEGLGVAAAAAAEFCLRHACDDAAGAARDLEVAAYAQRTVDLGIDREGAVALREHGGFAGRRLAAGRELHVVMRAVAEGLVLRR